MFETNDNQNAYRLRELVDGLDNLAAIARDLRAELSPPASALEAAWQIAPLTIRLKFVRDILPEDSSLRPALTQASALEDLRQRGDELNAWLTRYPSLFADAVELLIMCSENHNGPLTVESNPVFMLAMNTLDEAYRLLEVDLNRYGVVWILPSPGALITSDHEVVGEEPSQSHKATVARVTRRGFSRSGNIELPAQVVRSTGPAAQLPNIPLPPPSTAASLVPRARQRTPPNLSLLSALDPPSSVGVRENTGRGTERLNTGCESPSDFVRTPNAERRMPNCDPDWLRILGQRLQGCEADAVNAIVRDLQELVAAAQSGICDSPDVSRTQLVSILTPLVSLLGMRYADGIPGIGEEWGAALLEARDSIQVWLRETLSIEPISPQRGDRFDPKLMESIENRRTVHANEIDTVARVEKIGLVQAGAPIVRATVVRYVSGRE